MKYIFKIIILCLSFQSMNAQNSINLHGDSESYVYSYTLLNVENGNEKLLRKEAVEGGESKLTLPKLDKDGEFLLLIFDNKPSLSRSCIFSQNIKELGGNNLYTVNLNDADIKLELTDTLIPKLQTYNESSFIVGRLRRLDKYGKIDRWCFFKKVKGKYICNVNMLNQGKYFVDFYVSSDLKLSGERNEIGHSVYKSSFVVSKNIEKTITLN